MLRSVIKSIPKRSLLLRRNFHITNNAFDAKVFDMPAMSPTMETGSVVEWKVKEGQHFNSGDPILDIETDKATISVDAIDDGILAKILLPDGSKDIKVGSPIAFVAEDGDDLSKLEYPKISSNESNTSAAKNEAAPIEEAPKKEMPKEEKPISKTDSPTSKSKTDPSQLFFPSVELLLAENNISRETAIKNIPATGPHGRILKGDVLAYLGKITSNENQLIADYLDKTSHLDLSKIELKEKPTSQQTSSEAKSEASEPKKSSKKEPVTINKSYPLNLEISYSQLNQLKNTISNVISEAEHQAYAYNLNEPSDLDDPLFDDIIAPSRNLDRFQVVYKLNSVDDTDIESIDLQLKLNDKCFDAKDRAVIFTAAFKDILDENIKQYQE